MKVKISTLRRIIKEEIGNLTKDKSLNEAFSPRTEYLKDYLSEVGLDPNVPQPTSDYPPAVTNVLRLLRSAATAAAGVDQNDPNATGQEGMEISAALQDVWVAFGGQPDEIFK